MKAKVIQRVHEGEKLTKVIPGFGGIVLKRCLKFSSLGKRQANKVFVPSVVVMDLLRGG